MPGIPVKTPEKLRFLVLFQLFKTSHNVVIFFFSSSYSKCSSLYNTHTHTHIDTVVCARECIVVCVHLCQNTRNFLISCKLSEIALEFPVKMVKSDFFTEVSKRKVASLKNKHHFVSSEGH